MRSPFDPLKYLKYELRLHLELDSKGDIVVHGMNYIPSKKQMQARKILAIYSDLLLMQLDAPHERMRPSVRKLLAQGKILIKDGQYVLAEAKP